MLIKERVTAPRMIMELSLFTSVDVLLNKHIINIAILFRNITNLKMITL